METELEGRFWLNSRGAGFLGSGRVALLEAIAEHGSIAAAARGMRMSYKAAWDAVQAINNLADRPLVTRATGGRGGGGARLTDYGTRLVAQYRQAEAEYTRLLAQLADGMRQFGELGTLMRRMSMRTSARNQFQGSVDRVTTGAVNDEIGIDIGDGVQLVAIVTREASRELGLSRGRPVYALIDASAVTLTDAVSGARYSARNQLTGTVAQVTPGAVNGEIGVELANGRLLSAMVGRDACDSDWLRVGQPVRALIKAQHVILAVND